MGSTLQLTLLSGALALAVCASGCAAHHAAHVVVRRAPVSVECDTVPVTPRRVCDCYPSAATCFCNVRTLCSCPRVFHHHSLGYLGTRAVIKNRHRIGTEARRSGRKINAQAQRLGRQTKKQARRRAPGSHGGQTHDS